MYEFIKIDSRPRYYAVLSYGMQIGEIYTDRMWGYTFICVKDFNTEDIDAEEVEDIKREFDEFLYAPRYTRG